MTATSHAIVGAAIITKIPDLRIALPIIFLTHVLGDLPDHWDTGTNWQQKGMKRVFRNTIIDVLGGYLIIAAVFLFWLRIDPVSIFLGVLTSQLLDYMEIPYFFLRWHTAPWSWVNSFQHLFHKKLPSVNLTLNKQIVINLLFLAWALAR